MRQSGMEEAFSRGIPDAAITTVVLCISTTIRLLYMLVYFYDFLCV